jgi:hypothetical protein
MPGKVAEGRKFNIGDAAAQQQLSMADWIANQKRQAQSICAFASQIGLRGAWILRNRFLS